MSSPSRNGRRRRAFTLVELLVVIGIIALLVSILLPTLGRARRQAQAVACQSNLRQIGQVLAVYQAQNRGSYPWGFHYNNFDPATMTGVPVQLLGKTAVYSLNWASMVDTIIKTNTQNTTAGLWTGWSNSGLIASEASGVFRCPAADSGAVYNPIHYGANPVIMTSPPWERNYAGLDAGGFYGGKPQPLTAPARQNMVYPDNAILWDTNIDVHCLVGGSNPQQYTCPSILEINWGYSGIDGAQLLDTSLPQARFRATGEPDPFLGVAGAQRYEPIYYPSATGSSSGAALSNKDMMDGSVSIFAAPSPAYVNNIQGMRFRHGNQDVANVLMADGSVRSFTLNQKRAGPLPGSAWTDFMRYMLQPKYPTGIKASTRQLSHPKGQ